MIRHRPFRRGAAARECAVIWLSLAVLGLRSWGAAPASSLRLVVTTNYIVVTNIVLVTNYVVFPNTGLRMGEGSLGLERTHSVLPDLNWVPPKDSFDWIQLKSGEWLKGRVKAMQERQLEFYSEELKDQTFDWKDIRKLRTAHTQDVLFSGGERVSGPISVTPDQVTVGAGSPRVAPRGRLQSFTPGGVRERNYWSGKVSLGLNVRGGNTEQVESMPKRICSADPRRRDSVSITSAASAAWMAWRALTTTG